MAIIWSRLQSPVYRYTCFFSMVTALLSLGKIPDVLCAIRLVALEAVPGRDKVAALQAALDKVDVPGLVQDVVPSARALEHDLAAAELLERLLYLGQAERLVGIGLDAGLRQRHERVEHLEETKRPREVVDDLEAGGIVRFVARRCQCVDTGCVLVVFVGPEVSITATDRRQPRSASPNHSCLDGSLVMGINLLLGHPVSVHVF